MARSAWMFLSDYAGNEKVTAGKPLPRHAGFIDYANPGWQPHMMAFDLWEGTEQEGRFTPGKIIAGRISSLAVGAQ